jgi:excisionase family DNA binding protein
MMTETTASPYVPIEDVAKYLSVSLSTVRAWVRQGYIPKHTYIKVGNTYRFRLAAVVEHLTNDVPSEAPVGGTGGGKYE